jgi:poly(rC)-binding protein 2/3/4
MNTPSGKRKRDRGSADRNPRRRERPERLDRVEPDSSAMPTPDDTTYRILCSSIKIGTVIGRGGSIIKSLRRETNARIKVLDPIPGAEERVVLIWSTLQDEERKKYRDRREENEDRNAKDGDGENRKKSKDSPFEPVCPAQDALFRVHAKIIENERNGGFNDNANNNDEDDEDEGERDSDNAKSRSHQHHHNDGNEVIARLLVPNNQIGCLLGKGGRVIEKMRNETGAQIRITSKETLPTCALPTDELVQVSMIHNYMIHPPKSYLK